jgi:acetate kinase
VSILVINAGSSSVKCGVFDFETLEPVTRGLLDWGGRGERATVTLQHGSNCLLSEEIEAPDYRSAVIEMLARLREAHSKVTGSSLSVRAVGHRLIHGGEELREPVLINDSMKQKIRRTAHLAPLHIPPGLETIDALEAALPESPQIGLFDTAFFARMPPAAYLYPVPYEWYEQWGIRRFGFHGISHSYCTLRAAELLQERRAADEELPYLRHPAAALRQDAADTQDVFSSAARPKSALSRIVICHLGQGASATAVLDGDAVMNTMGFTPLEGLTMGTRSGTVDPGLLLHVQRQHQLTLNELDRILHKESGLLGLSGVSADFRKVEAAAADGHERALLALDVYAYRIRSAIGALAVSIGGLDALVFAGGIGENSSRLRTDVCRGLECLGVELDADQNESCEPDKDIASANSQARVLVIRTREEFMIARETRRLVMQS